MKYTLTFLALFGFISGFSQNHDIVLRNQSLGFLNRSEIVEIDSLNPKPESDINSLGYVLDLGYKRTNPNGRGYFIRVGLREFNQKSSQINLINQGRDGYRLGTANQKALYYSLNGGIFTTIFQKEKISTTFGSELQLRYKPPHEIVNQIDQFSRDENLLGSSVFTLGSPRNIAIGLNLNLSTYYFILKKLAVGIELNLGYLFDNTKGDLFDRSEILDEEGEIIADIEIPHIINRNSINRQFLLGFGIEYRLF